MDALVIKWNNQADQIKDLLQDIADGINANATSLTELRVRLDEVSALYKTLGELYYTLGDGEKANKRGFFNELKNTYFKTAAIIQSAEKKKQLSSVTTGVNVSLPFGHSTLLDTQRFLGLPPIDLPKFDGSLDGWLAFKANFRNEMTRLGIDSITSLHYLKKALIGGAANTLDFIATDEGGYEEAWKLLTSMYEHQRVIASTHLNALIHYPVITEASSQPLAKMVETVRQHMLRLKALEVIVPDYLVILLLERALPTNIRDKWEKKTSLDKIPDLESFFNFLQETSNRLRAREGEESKDASKTDKDGKIPAKRAWQQSEKGSKFRRSNGQARALVTNSALTCYHCDEGHTIYRCPAFSKLTVQQRWEVVRKKNLCKVCLRPHDGKCEDRKCKKCDKLHNTLLHEDKKAGTVPKKL